MYRKFHLGFDSKPCCSPLCDYNTQAWSTETERWYLDVRVTQLTSCHLFDYFVVFLRGFFSSKHLRLSLPAPQWLEQSPQHPASVSSCGYLKVSLVLCSLFSFSFFFFGRYFAKMNSKQIVPVEFKCEISEKPELGVFVPPSGVLVSYR